MHLVFYDRARFNLGVAALGAYLAQTPPIAGTGGRISVICDDVYPFRVPSDTSGAGAAAARILAREPDVVGMSIFSYDKRFLFAVNREIKRRRPGLITVAGGIHATLSPADTLQDGSFDYGVVGEGEEPLQALLAGLHSGELDPSTIANMAYRTADGGVRVNPAHRFSGAPDALPIPDYRPYLERLGGILPYMTARGCPCACTYCANNRLGSLYAGQGPRVRRRSPGRVVADLEVLARQEDVRRVFFFDDDFCFDREWLQRFAPRYAERVGLPYQAFANPNSLREEDLSLLRQSGCEEIKLGLQTFDEGVRRDVCRRRESIDRIKAICQRARAIGLRVSIDLIMGLPGDSAAQLEGGLLTASRLGAYKFVIYWLVLFPRTEIVEIALARGLITQAQHEAIHAGELTGLTHNMGSLPRHNRQFLPAAVMLSLLPLLPAAVSEMLITSGAYRRLPRSLWLCRLLDVLTALIHRDHYRLQETGAFLRHLRTLPRRGAR